MGEAVRQRTQSASCLVDQGVDRILRGGFTDVAVVGQQLVGGLEGGGAGAAELGGYDIKPGGVNAVLGGHADSL
jgi:hypothetical protein